MEGRTQAEVAMELVKSTTVSSEAYESGQEVPNASNRLLSTADGGDGPSELGGNSASADQNNNKSNISIENSALDGLSAADTAAITKIQSQVRGRNSRREMQEQNDAASKLQAQLRGRIARKELEDQQKAALVVQSRVRGMNAHKSIVKKSEEGVPEVSPRTAMADAIMKDVEMQVEGANRDAENKAASALQAQVRGRNTRKQMNEERLARAASMTTPEADDTVDVIAADTDELNAALKIQSRHRGALGRRAAQERADVKQKEDYEASIVKIQSRARGFLGRRMNPKSSPEHGGERASREARAALLEGVDQNSVVKIQSRARGLLARKNAQQRQERAQLLKDVDKNSVVRLQARARGMLSRKGVGGGGTRGETILEEVEPQSLLSRAEDQFGIGAGLGPNTDVSPEEVFSSKEAAAKRKIKQEAMARRRLKEEARLRKARLAQEKELSQRRDSDLEMFQSAAAAAGVMTGGLSSNLPPLNPSAPSGKPSGRGKYKQRAANLKGMNLSGVSNLDPDAERQRLGLPPSPRAPSLLESELSLKRRSPVSALRISQDDSSSPLQVSPNRPKLPSLGLGPPMHDPYGPPVERRKLRKPLYKRFEENYKKQQAEAERKKNQEYQKLKMKRQLQAPSRDEILRHRRRVDALRKERDETVQRRRHARDDEKEMRTRYEPVVRQVRQPTIREQFLMDASPEKFSPSEGGGRGDRDSGGGESVYRRQIKREMAEKRSAKLRELDKRRDKIERARSYGEKVRRAAPGTVNQAEEGGDMELETQSYMSPTRTRRHLPPRQESRRTNGRLAMDGGDDGDQYSRRAAENKRTRAGSDGDKDYYELLGEREARTEAEASRSRLRGSPVRRPPAGRQPLMPLEPSSTARGRMADVAERRAIRGDTHVNAPGNDYNAEEDQVALSSKQPIDERTAALMPKVSKWVANLMNSDGNEESLAKIYETGFQMLMAEKGMAF